VNPSVDLRWEERTEGACALHGTLVFATAAAALAEGRGRLGRGALSRLDLAGLVQADSAALAVLLVLRGEAARAGGGLTIEHPPASLSALASLCEVAGLLGLSAAGEPVQRGAD